MSPELDSGAKKMLFGHQKLGPQFLITWNKNDFKDIDRIKKEQLKKRRKMTVRPPTEKRRNKYFFKHSNIQTSIVPQEFF